MEEYGREEILSALKRWWGYDGFRLRQEEIVRSALEGKDTLGILPTGGGKSVCFQLPALMRDGLALVISPLIALMKDQVRNLQSRGIKALAIHTGMTRREVDTALNTAAYGDIKFLYVSPERLNTQMFRSYLPLLDVNFIVVDEAHCISQWGYDFRPDYLQIASLRESIDAPVIALTATATPEVAADIMDKLSFGEKNVIKSGFERDNLAYRCLQTPDRKGEILRCCNSLEGSGIVYVRSRKLTEELASFLRSSGIKADCYHAGLSGKERSRRQDEWIRGNVRVMVCTNAFGMGIDKSDVRFVLHYGMPDSVEAYFQEAGRAGRDGKPSLAQLFWCDDDCRRLRELCTKSYPPLEYIEGIYHKVHAFFHVPYESGMGKELRFNLEDFCKEYGLNRTQAHYAIEYLDRCGLWTLMENVEVSTKVMVTVDRKELYEIETPYSEMRTVLTVLMRRYEALFSYPVVIDEEYVASKAAISISVLRQMLYLLSVQHIIRYIPCTTSDVIFLRGDRLHPKDVNLQPQLYEMLRRTATQRTEAMISYVRDADTCRSQALLAYFGQRESAACGKCDVCLSKGVGEAQTLESLEAQILQFVRSMGGKYTLGQFQERFAVQNGRSSLRLLRRMLDDNLVPPPVQ